LPLSVSPEKAQTACEEECDSGNDDNHNVSFRRSSNRKRRVVFDFTDEDEDDVVSLASPDFPNKQSSQDSRQNDKNTSEKTTLNFDSQEENKSRVKEERGTDQKAHLPLRDNVSAISKCTNTGKSSSEKLHSCASEPSVNEDTVNKAHPCSPKKRKVMKSRIDERGREGTYIWKSIFFTQWASLFSVWHTSLCMTTIIDYFGTSILNLVLYKHQLFTVLA